MNSAKKHEFKNLKNSSDKMLICSKCFEMLFRDDIEHFPSCPYCNAPIDMNEELEDYLLKPFVDTWISTANRTYSEILPPEN